MENAELQLENDKLKNQLKKYTNPARSKRYYKNHKDECIKKSNERLKNLPKEKLQEYRRRAYLKMKEKKINKD
jgi:regulator of replication initiation timing